MANLRLRSPAGGSVTLTVDPALATDEEIVVQDPIGVNQTWQVMSAERDFGVDYTNDTGRPIFISITNLETTADVNLVLMVDGLQLAQMYGTDNTNGKVYTVSSVIPAGSVYSILDIPGTNENHWMELR